MTDNLSHMPAAICSMRSRAANNVNIISCYLKIVNA